jgi:hypothetical protein
MGDLISSMMWLAGATFAPFFFLDKVIASDVKIRLVEFLRSKPDALNDLPSIAAKLFTRIFGAHHYSFRCLFASMISSLFFLTLIYIMRILLMLAVHKTATSDELHNYVLSELAYPFAPEVRTSFAISLVANLVFDFFGLLKTRFIIRFLTRRATFLPLISIAVVIDFVFSFVIFQIFYLAFYFVSLFFVFGHPQTLLLPGGDPTIFMPMLAEIMILLRLTTSKYYPSGAAMSFLTHSHVIQVILASILIPIFITSVFFYASIAPSIWLWLFFFAGILSRVLAPAWPSALHVFNFEQSPFAILGLVASALVLLVFTFGLFLLALGPVIFSTVFS